VVVGEGAKLEIATLALYMWLTQANRYRRFIVSLLPHSVGRLDFFLRFKSLPLATETPDMLPVTSTKPVIFIISNQILLKFYFLGAFGESGRRDESTFDLMAGGLSR
jgi:hypothetical protein